MLSPDRASELLEKHLKSENLKKHCVAAGAVMAALARHLNQSEADWRALGLIHDLDFDFTRDTPAKHTLVAEELLKEEDVSEDFTKALKAHNELSGVSRTERLDYLLSAAESITGLIIACALVYPDKKISSVKPKSIIKRMKEPAFARNVSRECIMECEKAGIPFPQFVEISLSAMSEIQDLLICE